MSNSNLSKISAVFLKVIFLSWEWVVLTSAHLCLSGLLMREKTSIVIKKLSPQYLLKNTRTKKNPTTSLYNNLAFKTMHIWIK